MRQRTINHTRNRTLLAVALPALCVFATQSIAATTVIEGWQHPPNAEKNIGATEIKVQGTKTKYTSIRNKKVNAWIVVKGHEPARTISAEGASIKIESKTLQIPNPTALSVYKVRFDYVRPVSRSVANQRLRPVKMCNDRLSALSGDAKNQFLKEGDSFWINQAYDVALTSKWLIRAKKQGVFEDPPEHQTWQNETTINAKVVCLPLDKNPGAKRTNPPAPDPSTLPKLKKTTLTISPFAVEQVGSFQCPAKLRLKGYLESNRSMRGSTIFVGPQWLSGKKDYKFDGAQSMNHIATYTLKWGGNINNLGANTGAPYRQDLTFKFNVTNRKSKLIETVSRDIRVTCK